MLKVKSTTSKFTNLKEEMAESIRNQDRYHEIVNAASRDEDTDKVKLTREQEAELCQQHRLGYYVVGENGIISFRWRPCKHYDLCEDCRKFEAYQRRERVEDKLNKYKEKHPEAKKRVKLGIPDSKVEALEKRIKRHGGKFHSAEGELPGTKDIIAVMDDDPRRNPQEMEDIYGVENFEYDYEESLARQAERSAAGEQKRMAGPLVKKSAPPAQKDTYRLRLPKFRVAAKDRHTADILAKKCRPLWECDTEEKHQRMLYEIANQFGKLLEEKGIEYDVKMSFKNVTEKSREELNRRVRITEKAKCPDNSPYSNKEEVNRTFYNNGQDKIPLEYTLDD